MKSKVIENASKEADRLLKEHNIKILSNHKEKIFLFFIKEYSDPSEIFYIPGNLLSDEQYLIVAACQQNFNQRTKDNMWEENMISFRWCVECWFTERSVSYGVDADAESHGCLVNKSIPFDPCESYVFVDLSY